MKCARYITSSAPYILLAITSYSMFCVTVDDPFITFRYAANVLAGHGPVFNVGQRVEADTSPLHMLICILLMVMPLGVGMLFKAKLFSIIMAGLTIWQTARLAKLLGLSNVAALFAQIIVALSPNFATTAVNGLETTLYAFLLTLSTIQFITELQHKNGYLSGLTLFITFLARPEGLLIFAVLFVVRMWNCQKERNWRKLCLPWVISFIVPGICFFAGRYVYYRLLLPNTFYAKLSEFDPHGALYYVFVSFVLSHPGQHIPGLLKGFDIAFWLFVILGISTQIKRWKAVVILVVLAAQMAAVIRSGGDWMPGWRFMVPVLPEAVLFQLFGMKLAFDSISSFMSTVFNDSGETLRAGALPHGKYVVGAVWLACWMALFAFWPKDSWARAHFTTADEDLMRVGGPYNVYWIQISDLIHLEFRPGTIVAYSEMGYAGYDNPGITFIDTRGLTDGTLPKLYPASKKTPWGIIDYDWNKDSSPMFSYLRRHHPAAIISFDFDSVPPTTVLGTYKLQRVFFERYRTLAVYVPMTQRF